MRGAGMDFQDNFFVCIFDFRTKLRIPNRFAKGKGQWSEVCGGSGRATSQFYPEVQNSGVVG